jgi:hypothetical protein
VPPAWGSTAAKVVAAAGSSGGCGIGGTAAADSAGGGAGAGSAAVACATAEETAGALARLRKTAVPMPETVTASATRRSVAPSSRDQAGFLSTKMRDFGRSVRGAMKSPPGCGGAFAHVNRI